MKLSCVARYPSTSSPVAHPLPACPPVTRKFGHYVTRKFGRSLHETMKQKGRRQNPPIGVSYRETTRDERMRIIALRENAGWTWSKIGRELNINRRTCERIYNRWKADDTPSNRKRSGRPPIFDDAERARLEAFVTRDALALGVLAGRLFVKRWAARVILVPLGKLCTRWDITRGFRERSLMSAPRIRRSGWPDVKHDSVGPRKSGRG